MAGEFRESLRRGSDAGRRVAEDPKNANLSRGHMMLKGAAAGGKEGAKVAGMSLLQMLLRAIFSR